VSASREFAAPWSLSLRLMTLFGSAVLLGVAAVGLLTGPRDGWYWPVFMVGMPFVILLVASFFRITGYRVERGRVVVRRPGWTSAIDLTGLESVRHEPGAMARSLRIFGNGGLFCFAGRFRNRTLGSFRAYASDPAESTVLRFADRTVVVTPERPKRFVEAVTEAASLGDYAGDSRGDFRGDSKDDSRDRIEKTHG